MFLWFQHNTGLGIFLFRLFISIRILYGVIDNVFSWRRMIEFSHFLDLHHFPLPIFMAILSVSMQLVAGLMILVGWRTRLAALIVIINFLVAIIMVHRNDSLEAMTPALAMLFGAVLLLFTGPGVFALEKDPE